jgi:hypothetical protein
MTLRTIDDDGHETVLQSPGEVKAAIATGRLTAATLVYHESEGRWVRADAHPTCQAARRAVHERAMADAAPTPAGPSPATDGTDVQKGTRAAWVFAGGLVVLTLLLLVYSPARGPYRFAELAGSAVSGLLFGSIFLGWKKRTRPYISWLAAGFMVLAAIGWSDERAALQTDVRQEVGRIDALLDEVERSAVDGNFEPLRAASSATTAPATAEGRMLRIAESMLRDVALFVDSINRHYGVDVEPPEVWLEPAYYTGAARYPEVALYFEAALAALDDFESTFRLAADEIVLARAAEANLSQRLTEEWIAGARIGLDAQETARQKLNDATRALGHVSLDLHEFLVQNRARIVIGDDGLVYGTTDWVHDELVRMLGEIETLSTGIVQAQEDAMAHMRRMARELEKVASR